MTTIEIMQAALALAGLESAPEDTGISVTGENIQKILMGIDMESPELLLAKELGYDCVVSHHPYGGLESMNFHKVLAIQIDKMVSNGIPINRAQKALRKKIAALEEGAHPKNYDKVDSMAKLLQMPYLNIHLPADLITEGKVQGMMDVLTAQNPKLRLQDVLDELNTMMVYQQGLSKPVIRVGSANDYAGKVLVLMAGGTNGGVDVFKAYFDAGVGTIVCMHVPEDVKKAVEEQNIGNVIVAGHMTSDSIGLHEIIKLWRGMGLEVTTMSGIVNI
jgi:hypothetical protein